MAFRRIVSRRAMRLSRLRVCIPGFVTAGRLRVRTLDALVGDRRGSNVASADVEIERLGKCRCRNEDKNRRCGQNTFHSILLFDVTWNPPAFPDARPLCCCESRWQQRTFAFNSFHVTMERRVQYPTLNDRSATHVFVAAIGTTAFLRSTAVRFCSVAHVSAATQCPLYPRKRTCAVQLGTAALGQ